MTIDSYYIIEIKMKKGSAKYVSLGQYRPNVVTKNNAEKILTYKQARIISEYFWSDHWDHEKYDTREIVYVKARS